MARARDGATTTRHPGGSSARAASERLVADLGERDRPARRSARRRARAVGVPHERPRALPARRARAAQAIASGVFPEPPSVAPPTATTAHARRSRAAVARARRAAAPTPRPGQERASEPVVPALFETTATARTASPGTGV